MELFLLFYRILAVLPGKEEFADLTQIDHKVEGDSTDKIALLVCAQRPVIERIGKPGDYLLHQAWYSTFQHLFEPALKTCKAIRLVGAKKCARCSKRFSK